MRRQDKLPSFKRSTATPCVSIQHFSLFILPISFLIFLPGMKQLAAALSRTEKVELPNLETELEIASNILKDIKEKGFSYSKAKSLRPISAAKA